MADDDQSDLISALKQGDRAAWCVVVERYLREVYGFIFHLVRGDRAIAEDLNQETWLEAVDGIERCDEVVGSFRTWLYGIARKRVAMYYRQRASTKASSFRGEQNEGLVEWENQSIMPDDVLEEAEKHDVVRAALLVLPEDRRNAVLSKYVDGLSVEAIATRTGRTAKAVESLLSRTREQLRGLLAWYLTPGDLRRPVSKESSDE